MFWIVGGSSLFLELFTLWNTPLSSSFASQLRHSEWNGFTFYDLIFPLFLFIVGTCIPFSIARRQEKGASRKMIYLHTIKRAIILFLLGLIVNGFLNLNFAEQRWAGVLQRIALAYFFTVIIVMNASIKRQVVITGGILLLYWYAMTLIPVPGFGRGMLTAPGNLAGYLDRELLPGGFCCYYHGDNEGILSTLPSISTVLLGVLSAHWVMSSRPENKKVLGLFIAGVTSLALGLVWNPVFPINKLIWSSSYVLYAGGWSILLLCFFYWLIDVRGHGEWAFPFTVIGMNAITIYVATELFDFGIIARIFVGGFVDNLGAIEPVFWAACVLTVEWLFLYFLYRKRIFLKA
jgi:predicted acyltransferase